MAVRVAYVRLLLAETLIAVGQDSEAIREIALALQVADSEGIGAQIQAGAGLLYEALARGSRGADGATEKLLFMLRLTDRKPCG